MYYYYVLQRALGCLPMIRQPLALSQSCRDHTMKYTMSTLHTTVFLMTAQRNKPDGLAFP